MVVDEVVDIKIDGKIRVSRTVGIESLHLHEAGQRSRRLLGSCEVPKDVPVASGRKRSVGCLGVVATAASGRLDGVVVLVVSAKISLAVIGLGPFLGHEEPPVDSIEVKMVVSAPSVGLTKFPLQITTQHFTQEGIGSVPLKSPRVVL